MKNKYTVQIFVIALFFLSVNGHAQSLLNYWNFNNSSSVAAVTTPTQSIVPGAALVVITGGTSVIEVPGTGQNFELQNLNAQNADVAGTHLRFNNPIGGQLEFSLPTTGFQGIVVKYSTRRSTQGAGTQNWSYSTDGTTYIAFSSVVVTEVPTLATLDFSAISGVNNNPNFKIRVAFVQGAGGITGNNRFDNFTTEGTSFGGVDTTAPIATVNPINGAASVNATQNFTFTFNEAIRLVDNSAITNANVGPLIELRLNNSAGSLVPFTAMIMGNIITIDPTNSLVPSQVYYLALLPNTVEDLSNNAVSINYDSTFTIASPSVAFASNFMTVNENHGILNVVLNVESPASGSVDLVLRPSIFNTANNLDFTFASQTISITPSSPAQITVQIPIIDDNLLEQQAEYFVIGLENASNTAVLGTNSATIYIRDNDRIAKVPSQQIRLNYVGSFDPSGASTSTCEIVVHDQQSQRLFTTSAVAGLLDIIDFSNPLVPTVISSINILPYGGITSVAVRNGILAVASPNANEQLPGSVVFFNTSGQFQKQVTVGVLPDMITFTPDGTKVLTANEGQPNTAYTVDPEGSVSVIDVSGGIASLTQANVTTLSLAGYNTNEAAIIASGVRKVRSTSTLAQDLEPEYIAIDANSQKAWIVAQENNAMIELNLVNNTLGDIWGLGSKDISLVGNGMDISDNNGQILIANWPMKALYNPDGIVNFNVNGVNYIATANEGDERDIAGFSERTTVGNVAYNLDATIFPNASVLKQTFNMGRFRVSNATGNLDADPEFEEIRCLGSRSFSIFNADTKQIVFDSGDDFEMYTAQNFPTVFNANHENNTPKGRSSSKGPEPEGITTATIAGRLFAFISLERIGGVMVYDITDPANVTFVDYKNSRSTSAYSGDQGPEGITYIPANQSPNGKGYILIANEVSGTITTFEIDATVLSTVAFNSEIATFNVFPNPANKGIMYFNRKANIELFDISGKKLSTQKEALTIDTTNFASGVYILKTDEGLTRKLIIR
jgi:hypothetical protein